MQTATIHRSLRLAPTAGAPLLLALLVASCGGAMTPTSTSPAAQARAEPLPVSENQQGPLLPEPEPEIASSAADVPVTPGEPIMGVYLWCADRDGRACQAASAALGTGPKASALPPALLEVEDRTDDCSEPTIQEVSRRLASAFNVTPTGWRDQAGVMLDPSLLSDMYQAAGCINDLDQASPVAKISAGSVSSPRLYLVRVWDEGQEPH